jgi:hypothetical protein
VILPRSCEPVCEIVNLARPLSLKSGQVPRVGAPGSHGFGRPGPQYAGESGMQPIAPHG